MSTLPTIPAKLMYSYPEAAFVLSCGESFLRGLVAAGKIAVCREGRAVWFHRAELERYAQSLLDAAYRPTTAAPRLMTEEELQRQIQERRRKRAA